MELKCFFCAKMNETTEFHLTEHCSVLRNKHELGIKAQARSNRLYLRYN